ncbi:OmpW family protein [Plastorhodobacter daqingensis]|uniref:OmpW family protein n=1 Tax=Plastorhodobacter daqingensis TaxID=1387281 RepID=A0ABW2UFI1_9RHOB
MKTTAFACSLVAACALAAPAVAQQAGDWTLGFGLHSVQPRSNNGSLADGTLAVDVGSNIRPTVTFEYFIRDNVGIEVLAAWPFKHDISIDGLGKVGTTQHLPPVVSLQYHFTGLGSVTPFLGAGVNYTAFFSEKTTGALTGNDLSLKNSWGLALHAGLDYRISDRGALRADLRWIDIDTKVRLNGEEIGTVKIDPVVAGLAYVHRF